MMRADEWPYASLRAALAAEPGRVHVHIGTQAQGEGWGKPIPHTTHTFGGPRSGHLPSGFRVGYHCLGVHGATQLVLRVRVGSPIHEHDAPVDALDLGYHAYEAQYEGQDPMSDCHLLGGACFCDGSGLNAGQALGDKLLAAGPERWEAAAFEVVIAYYEQVFGVSINRETLAWELAWEHCR